MAKSMRSKREKRLRAIRRDIVKPLYEKKDEAKLAAQEAALAAAKLPVPVRSSSTSMDVAVTPTFTSTNDTDDVEMDDGKHSSLKPAGGIGKKSQKKFKLGKNKRRGKGWKKQKI